MRHLFVLLLCCHVGSSYGVNAAEGGKQLDEIVQRHKEFAVSRIKDQDSAVASTALDALCTLDPAIYLDQLRDKLDLPLTDPPAFDLVALVHLIGRATPNDLDRVRTIIQKAALKGEQERKKEPFDANAAMIESFALEVLLASRDAEAVRFATAYLEELVKRNPEPGIAQMDFAIDLVGRFKLKSAAAIARTNSRTELQNALLFALAKNGEQAAIDTLQKQVKDKKNLWAILSDHEIVETLALTTGQLRVLYQDGDLRIRIAAAGQLAGTGSTDELRTITKVMLATADLGLESRLHLETALGKFGDESLIPSFDLLTLREPPIARLQTSKIIFQIVARRKSSDLLEKAGGDGKGPGKK